MIQGDQLEIVISLPHSSFAHFKQPVSNNMPKLIRLNEVKILTTLSRSTIYKKIAEGSFPKPIKLGDRAVAWLEHDVLLWIENRINSHRSTEA